MRGRHVRARPTPFIGGVCLGTRDDNVSLLEEIMIEAATTRSPTMLLLVFMAWLLLSLLVMIVSMVVMHDEHRGEFS